VSTTIAAGFLPELTAGELMFAEAAANCYLNSIGFY
jgi:hypothetical protein